MKVITKHQVNENAFIFTRVASEFTDYELSILKKLYENGGLSSFEDQYEREYNSVISNFIKIGLIYEDYEDIDGTRYQMSKNCIEKLLKDFKERVYENQSK